MRVRVLLARQVADSPHVRTSRIVAAGIIITETDTPFAFCFLFALATAATARCVWLLLLLLLRLLVDGLEVG